MSNGTTHSAGPSIEAGIAITVINVLVTVGPCPPRITAAAVLSYIILGGREGVGLMASAAPPALEGVGLIFHLPQRWLTHRALAVDTRVRDTLIDLLLTVSARVARVTVTLIAIHYVLFGESREWKAGHTP